MMLRTFLILLLASLAAPLAAQTCPAGSPRVAPDSRYVVSEPDPIDHAGEQVVRDLETGLEWKQCSEGQTGTSCTGTVSGMNWSAALATAQAANWAGHADWRLPNILELRSLIETGCSNPSINTTVFPGTPSGWYLSSTTRVSSPTGAVSISFYDGGFSNQGKTSNNLVRLVRAGQWADPWHTLSYLAGPHGSIEGNTSQMVMHAGNGTPVTAVPDAGYFFDGWSDGSTANPRTDLNVTGTMTLTARFSAPCDVFCDGFE